MKGVGSDAGVLATWGAYSDERGESLALFGGCGGRRRVNESRGGKADCRRKLKERERRVWFGYFSGCRADTQAMLRWLCGIWASAPWGKLLPNAKLV